jgi:hypothetical protein
MKDIEDPREVNHPRLTRRLLGHEAAEQRLLAAWASGRMHHAWLLAGPRGIGKATLAYRFARFLFTHPDPMAGDAPQSLEVAPEAPAAALVAARSHPDLLVVELLHHHGDLLSERRAAYRPRLRGDRDRRDRPLQAARRLRRVLPHRHRRARPEDAADGGARGITPRELLADRNAAEFQRMVRGAQLLERRLHPHHRAAPPRVGRRNLAAHGGQRRHLSRQIRRLVLGARRGLLRRGRDRGRDDGVRYGKTQGTPVEWVEEESYFFRLSAYQDKLLALYEAHPDFIGPDERRNEVVSFVKRRPAGPVDLAHHLRLGHPGAGRPKHVMYVWVDALTNYITAVGFPDEARVRGRYWPADVHVIGKDIVRFHASTGRPS